ncbi:nucleotidyl transferase AbiEii/AbiGii toxin family protein [Amycolatopsis australiensis]|uniref:Predicted nucleotidyltransferase component of viral defense system n=1 Tax=Amycolatopsis australiensis TaxID=546364 RepID=A0A1K1LKP5_9PSEU|nr:nucleotidyl transferase AbiEii/AbiGii toxin family protein [Amycolatopsis australiensis]SFW11473.1 Predicted nucleotidyltransferase component of viral defense system [Amycolatopsis australiensis]
MARQTGGKAGELLDLHFHRRLIARVFDGDDAGNWVLKGGQAMLVRWPAARYSTDVDLLSAEDTTDAAVEALKAAAARRLDDAIWFRHLSTSEQTHVDRPTRKVKFMAMFGNAPLNHRVSVDVVVSGHQPRGVITTEPLEPPFTTDCAPWPNARVFPFEDHVAEKICAMYELYRAGGNPSTRYKDLVDLVLFALKVTLPGAETHRILRDEVTRRQQRGVVLELPERFQLPDEQTWPSGYAKIAEQVAELPEHLRRMDHARLLADAFISPLLQPEPPSGSWRPDERAWR